MKMRTPSYGQGRVRCNRRHAVAVTLGALSRGRYPCSRSMAVCPWRIGSGYADGARRARDGSLTRRPTRVRGRARGTIRSVHPWGQLPHCWGLSPSLQAVAWTCDCFA